jgi:hypothetical protein
MKPANSVYGNGDPGTAEFDSAKPPERTHSFNWFAFTLLLVISLAGLGGYCWIANSPNVLFLQSVRGAEWIRNDRPLDLHEHVNDRAVSIFATDFIVPHGVSHAVLHLWALRRALVLIDGRRVFDTGPKLDDWRIERSIELPPAALSARRHRLEVPAANQNGPVLIRADCSELGIHTDSEWLVSADRKQWTRAAPADRAWEPEIADQFETTTAALRRLWPLMGALLVVGAALSLLVLDRQSLTPNGLQLASRLRWTLLLGWAVLAVNNLAKLPAFVGYDAPAHFEYIQFIARNGSLPLPDRGSQFFQTPVYYIFSAGLYKLLAVCGLGDDRQFAALRILPFLCGALMVQLCYVAAGYIFPLRGDLRAVATVVGGLAPVNLYMAQSLSNEPMAGCVTGVFLLLLFRFLTRPIARPFLSLAGIGLLLGLCVLTKVSAMVWLPALMFALLARVAIEPWTWSRRCANLIVAPLAACCVVFPCFLRNRLYTGKWLFPNSQVAGNPWWQDPGFRTAGNLLTFGHVFARPAMNGFHSVWDSLYATTWGSGLLNGVIDYPHRPPWNYGLMSCGLWLALFPMLILALGSARAMGWPEAGFAESNRVILRFCVLGLGSFVAAVLYVFVSLPIYSCAKGSYLLGAIPCAALLAACGFDLLTRHRVLRTIACSVLFTWAVTSYFTYLVF